MLTKCYVYGNKNGCLTLQETLPSSIVFSRTFPASLTLAKCLHKYKYYINELVSVLYGSFLPFFPQQFFIGMFYVVHLDEETAKKVIPFLRPLEIFGVLGTWCRGTFAFHA